MSLIRNIREYLDEPGRHIVVITIDDVLSSYDELQDFVEDVHTFLGKEWDIGVQGRGSDPSRGKHIMLSMYPNQIRDHGISGERIYIIENTDELTHALTFHQLKP